MKKFLQVCILAFAIIPFIDVDAASITVHNQTELKEAIGNSDISEIVLANDIETTEKINILRPLKINGNGYTMKYVGTFGSAGSSDYTVWGGIYVLQVYKTEVTLKNIRLTGGNGGLLINGGKVTVEGTLDVSGNGFGGIELGQGAAVESVAHLVLASDGKIVNTTETEDRPTLWVPTDSTGSILEINGKQMTLEADKEITLADLDSLINPPENPSTGDLLPLYGVITLIGSTILLLTKKLNYEN